MRVNRLVAGVGVVGLLVGPPAVAAPADQPVTWVEDSGEHETGFEVGSGFGFSLGNLRRTVKATSSGYLGEW